MLRTLPAELGVPVSWLTQRAVDDMARRYGGHIVNNMATVAESANSGTPAVLAALTNGALAVATRSLANPAEEP
jgi:hypothetical protein